jgi:hypothetical protein
MFQRESGANWRYRKLVATNRDIWSSLETELARLEQAQTWQARTGTRCEEAQAAKPRGGGTGGRGSCPLRKSLCSGVSVNRVGAARTSAGHSVMNSSFLI